MKKDNIKEEKCEHNVVKKYCFNCKFKTFNGVKVEMFNNHHYIRLKDVNTLLQSQKDELVEKIEKEDETLFTSKKSRDYILKIINK